ncbi:MAG: hypothetical protein A4S09_13090 [Proteobacteria bacterium SG_bin7]|nr:MAG: hypothetical protein A4S09_13090 [Proteobacteria bacterium SG_bin7]
MPIQSIGRVSATSVKKGTGKNWDQWIEILERAGASVLTRKEIVVLLKKKYRLSAWWQQGVAHGYEVHTGRRIDGQNYKGEYSATITKSFPMDQKTLWKLMTSCKGINAWLKPIGKFSLKPNSAFEIAGEIFGDVRTVVPPKRIRLSWQDLDWEKKTYLEIHVVGRPNKGSILVFSHDGLKTSAHKEKMRKYWRAAVDGILGLTLSSG